MATSCFASPCHPAAPQPCPLHLPSLLPPTRWGYTLLPSLRHMQLQPLRAIGSTCGHAAAGPGARRRRGTQRAPPPARAASQRPEWATLSDEPAEEQPDAGQDNWRADVQLLTEALRPSDEEAEVEGPLSSGEEGEGGWPRERAYLVGVQLKSEGGKRGPRYSVHESLEELGRLADTAGLEVVGSTYQQLETISSRTYIGSGKVLEIAAAVAATGAETVIFDDELSPGQLRELGKALGDDVRICDRTALILDIFSQRAATHEGQLQVELAQSAYQLPRLTRMWTHLERQSGSGQVKGMGEKQIEVDKRLLRTRMAQLRKDLEEVRTHRKQYRQRRSELPMPVVALVGYTNAGKSTLLNSLTQAGVFAEDKLFATLDPTTRRAPLPSGKEVLFTDTVGFIQKLPTQLVAAFRATLEEISEASLLLHVVDCSHGSAGAQAEAVDKVLSELDVSHIPVLHVWNKVDACAEPAVVAAVAAARPNTVCCSALTGEGIDGLLHALGAALEQQMVLLEVLLPYGCGDVVDELHRQGIVKDEQFEEAGTRVVAYVPRSLAGRLQKQHGATLVAAAHGGNGAPLPAEASADVTAV